MNNNECEKYMRIAAFIKTLANPVRIFIFDKICEKPCCVSELCKLSAKKEPAISKHLSIMQEAGIILREKKGLKAFFRLNNPGFKRVWNTTYKCIQKKLPLEKTAHETGG